MTVEEETADLEIRTLALYNLLVSIVEAGHGPDAMFLSVAAAAHTVYTNTLNGCNVKVAPEKATSAVVFGVVNGLRRHEAALAVLDNVKAARN